MIYFIVWIKNCQRSRFCHWIAVHFVLFLHNLHAWVLILWQWIILVLLYKTQTISECSLFRQQMYGRRAQWVASKGQWVFLGWSVSGLWVVGGWSVDGVVYIRGGQWVAVDVSGGEWVVSERSVVVGELSRMVHEWSVSGSWVDSYIDIVWNHTNPTLCCLLPLSQAHVLVACCKCV